MGAFGCDPVLPSDLDMSGEVVLDLGLGAGLELVVVWFSVALAFRPGRIAGGGLTANSWAPGVGGVKKEDEGDGKGEAVTGTSRDMDRRDAGEKDQDRRQCRTLFTTHPSLARVRVSDQNASWHGIALFLFTSISLFIVFHSLCYSLRRPSSIHPILSWYNVNKKIKLIRFAERLCDILPRQRPSFVRIRDDKRPRCHFSDEDCSP